MRCLYISLCLFFSVVSLSAQDNFLKDYAPVAPTPASLGKYGDIPVSYHTGIPDISIPIHTLTEGSISVPVSLSYHASGIRVQETASWVGLGWALNAGGVITRTVQGAPDDGGNHNQEWAWYKNKGNPNNGTTCPALINIARGYYDTEPDMFSFNVGGYTGKFFYDQDTVIQIVPRQDITITTINLSGQTFSGWILTDPQGTRYHFGATSSGMAMTDYVEKSAYTDDSFAKTRNSSWYLSKIESADRKDVIQFTYVGEQYSFWEVSTSPADGGIICTTNPGFCNGGSVREPIRARIDGKRLSAITGTNGSIAFIGDASVRTDLSNYAYCISAACTLNTQAKALKTIEIRDKSSTCLRKFEFGYATITTANPGNPPSGYLPFNGDDTDKKRLILLSLSEQECGSTVNAKTHNFEYFDQTQLPRRLSFAQDHWGYFNGKTSNTSLSPGEMNMRTLCNNCQGNYAHVCTAQPDNREPAFPAMRNGTLKKITFPTGGSSSFDYEAHTKWGTDTTCTKTTLLNWNAFSGGSCYPSCTNCSNTNTIAAYSFSQSELDNGHIQLSIGNSCPGNSVSLDVYTSYPGTPVASITGSGYFFLKKIGTYTLQAGVSYTFRLNQYGSDPAFAEIYTLTRTGISVNKIVGGLRIKTITTNDGDATTSNNIVKNFEYADATFPTRSSGKVVHQPLYVALYAVPCDSINSDNGCTGGNCNYNATNANNYTLCPTSCSTLPRLNVVYSHSSLQPMQTTMGSHIGYTAVQVKETGNGKSEYRYNMGQYASGPWVPTGYPFPPPPYEPLLGTLASEGHYHQDGTQLRSAQYNYLTANVNVLTIAGRHANKVHWAAPGAITSQFYNMNTGYALLNQSIEAQYNTTGGTFVEKITDITYTPANGHYQKTTEEVTDSDGTKYRTKYKYVKDYPCPSSGPCDETNSSANAEAKAIYAMRKRNMVAIPIEQTTWLKRPSWGSHRLTGATYFQLDRVNVSYDNIKLKAVQQVRPASPLTSFTESTISSGTFSKSSSYTLEYNFAFSDTHGKILSQWKQNDPAKQQYLWGYNQKLPTAKIINAESNEVAYTSFEEINNGTQAANGNWTISNAISTDWNTATGTFYTGRAGFKLVSTRKAEATGLSVGSTVVVSCWHRDGQVKVNNTNIGSVAGATWQYAEITLSVPANGTITVQGASGANLLVDELRLYPADGLIRTFSYDERNLLPLSIADENCVPAHFDYDNFQRLQAVRDQDRNILQTYEYNYRPSGGVISDIKARTVLTSGQTTISQVNALSGANVRRVFQYFDGLGRPIQASEVGQSPTSKDIVVYQQYDQYGREPKQYIPYTAATNSGAYRSNAATEQSSFIYGLYTDNYGYAETRFEASPLNRVLEQAAPGAAWRIGLGHTMEYLYRGNTTTEAVRDFTNSNSFAADKLFTLEETDENERKKYTYTDKLGRVVMVKQQVLAPLSGADDDDYARTYTIYDDFGRVAAVIPPEAAKKMKTSGSWDWTLSTYASMLYKYVYDSRGRMISKVVPSGGTTTIAYDRLDRPVLTTDANGFKIFTRYDILSRPVVSGRYKGSASPGATDPLYETPNTTALHYYTSTAFPTDNNLDVYKVLYYDDYDLDNNGSIGSTETYTNPAESGYETAAFLNTRGKPTAAKTAILKNDNSAPTTYLTARTYYDKEYSVIQINKQNHLGGSDIISNAYDFANRLTKTRRDHTATPPGGTLKTYTIKEEYVYDHASRLRFTRHHIATSATPYPTSGWVVTSAPVYDELSRLADKRLHASNYDNTWGATLLSSNFNYLQSLDYTYNIRGWLTGLNDPASCSIQSGDNLVDMFRMQLTYETAANGGTEQFNGNIATMQWNTHINGTCGTRQLYRFAYDGANRLTAAAHRTWSGSTWTDPARYNESGITYDLNGNIKSYGRQGLLSGTSTFGTIDNLVYTYGDAARPDRLTQMIDAGSVTKGFAYNPAAATYQYDLNGNMTQDNHKGFTIAYNHLNLPKTMTKGADVIIMTYTADGEKLTKLISETNVRYYVSGIEYLATNLDAIYHAEGRCTPNGTSAFYYEYTLKDHLGNARVNFRANGTAVTFLEELHYYPFGMLMEGIGAAAVTVNKYKYNGKELNDDLGLNLSDYGARWYDAALGRWWSVDPLGEVAPDWTPYRYGFDNPILFFDQFGAFETKKEAKAYAKEHGIKTGWFRNNKIVKQEDGTYSIDNKKEGTSTYDDPTLGKVVTGVLVQDRGVHLRDIGLDRFNELRNPYSESYNPNAVVFTDGADIAYAVGAYLSLASPTAKGATANKLTVANVTNTTKTGTNLLNPAINITEKGLAHTLERHTINGISKWAGKSKFFNISEVKSLVQNATQMPMLKQNNGNFARIVDAGRNIGIDRATGNATSIYTVITNPQGNLITAFPGTP